uniref:Uncharacterized protein n=1 Tax=Opuntia streptacantha TaxID=393608 RepID=A0A7C9ETS6_OPUST
MLSLYSAPTPSLHKTGIQFPQSFFAGPSTKSSKHANRCRNQSLPLGIPSKSNDAYGEISPTRAIISNLAVDEISEENPIGELSDSQHLSQGPDPVWLASLLQSRHRLKDVKVIHAVILKCLVDSVIYVNNNLINVYLGFGRLEEARKVFDEMPERSVVSWTAMLNGYLTFGFEDDALCLLRDFASSDIRPNGMTLVCMLNLCGKRLDYELGRQVHAHCIKGRWRNLIVDSAILHLYAQCGDLLSAFQIFDQMKERDVVCWTAIITSYSQQGFGKLALSLFAQMFVDQCLPNEHTICSVLKACGEEKELRFGRLLHAIVIKKLVKADVFVGTSLVSMYMRCGEFEDSRKVFDRMKRRNMVTWTAIITGYGRNGLGYEALTLFRAMKRRKVVANNLTIVSILRACGSIGALLIGKEVHAQVLKISAQNNIYIGSTLVWLYCKCGEYALASKILQNMPLRDVVSWTAIISGCARLGHEFQPLEFLKEMLGEGVEPNSFTYSSILKACAKLEAVQQGKLIHTSVNKSAAASNIFVGSALINMYAKCGCVSEAFQVFTSMPEKNLVSWRSMIVGYAKNGYCHEALKLMYQMQAEGFQMDDYIVTIVLSECGDVEWNMEPQSKDHLQPS